MCQYVSEFKCSCIHCATWGRDYSTCIAHFNKKFWLEWLKWLSACLAKPSKQQSLSSSPSATKKKQDNLPGRAGVEQGIKLSVPNSQWSNTYIKQQSLRVRAGWQANIPEEPLVPRRDWERNKVREQSRSGVTCEQPKVAASTQQRTGEA
jgi:hypothetical protein